MCGRVGSLQHKGAMTIDNPDVVVYTTSTPTTLRTKSANRHLIHILDTLKINYRLVDLATEPQQLVRMLQASPPDTELPQVHCEGEYVGGLHEVQERHDFGELEPLLKGGRFYAG
jgi:glutaredoxin-related protein